MAAKDVCVCLVVLLCLFQIAELGNIPRKARQVQSNDNDINISDNTVDADNSIVDNVGQSVNDTTIISAK